MTKKKPTNRPTAPARSKSVVRHAVMAKSFAWVNVGANKTCRDWLAAPRAKRKSKSAIPLVHRVIQLMLKGGSLHLRVMGEMKDGRRMTKFFKIAVDEPLEIQIYAAIQVWNEDAGF